MKIPIEELEEAENGLEVVVHQLDDYLDVSAEECEFSGCIRMLAVTNLTPSEDRVQLKVVRCIYSTARAGQ